MKIASDKLKMARPCELTTPLGYSLRWRCDSLCSFVRRIKTNAFIISNRISKHGIIINMKNAKILTNDISRIDHNYFGFIILVMTLLKSLVHHFLNVFLREMRTLHNRVQIESAYRLRLAQKKTINTIKYYWIAMGHCIELHLFYLVQY